MTRHELERAARVPAFSIVSANGRYRIIEHRSTFGRGRVVGRGRLRLSAAGCEALLAEITAAIDAGWRAGVAHAALALTESPATAHERAPSAHRCARVGRA